MTTLQTAAIAFAEMALVTACIDSVFEVRYRLRIGCDDLSLAVPGFATAWFFLASLILPAAFL